MSRKDIRCRFCLASEVNELIPVFCMAPTQKILVSHMALACTGIVVSCRDKLPQYTCDTCLGNLQVAYACWRRCRLSWGNYKRNPTLDEETEDFRCRICLQEGAEELTSIFWVDNNALMKISDIIQRFSGLEVSEKDKFPQYVCDVCLGELNTGFNFRKLARESVSTLRSNSLENEKQSMNQTNSCTPSHTSVLNELLVRFESQAQEQSLVENAANEQRIQTLTETTNEANRPLIKPVPNTSNTNKRIPKPSPPTLIQTVFKRLALVIDNEPKTPQVESSSLQPTKVIPERVLQMNDPFTLTAKAADQAASDGNSTLKKASFSNPAEFKKLASRILNKPGGQPSSAPVEPKFRSTLVAKETKIIERMRGYTRSQITAFLCGNCDNVYSASAIRNTCVKCKTRFENYVPIALEFKTVQQGHIEAYCCGDCAYFSITVDRIIKHLAVHKQKISNRGIESGASKRTASEQSINPAVLRTTSVEPVPNKRSAEEPSEPVVKKQRTEDLKPQSEPKVLWKKVSDKWTRVESSGNTGEIEFIATQNNTNPKDLVEPQVVVQAEVKVLEPAVVELERDPLGITDAITITDSSNSNETVRATETTPHVDPSAVTRTQQSDQQGEPVASNEEFLGFEEEQLETPLLVPLTGRTPDSDLFDTLRDTDDYLMVFLKGYLCCGCLTPFRTPEGLKRHRTRIHLSVQTNVDDPTCETCRTSCSNAVDHRLLSAKRIFYYCKFCQSLLVLVDDFQSHLELLHIPETQQPHPGSPEPDVYDVILSHLDLELFLRKDDNITHAPNPFKLTDNDTIFKTLKEDKDYRLLFMRGEQCCGCKEWFSSRSALEAHLDKSHTAETDPRSTTQCELCHTDCRTDSRLMRHRLQRARRLYYFCNICRAVLTYDADNYQTHQAVAHFQQLGPQVSGLTPGKVAILISTAGR